MELELELRQVAVVELDAKPELELELVLVWWVLPSLGPSSRIPKGRLRQQQLRSN